MSAHDYPVVPFDPQVTTALARMPAGGGPPPSRETLPLARQMILELMPRLGPPEGTGVTAEEVVIDGPDGNQLALTILRPPPAQGLTPVLVNFHGGGTIYGDRFIDTERLVDLVTGLGVTVVTVEYRLAPEHPHPAPVEDCYAATAWVAANAGRLGVDAASVVVMGGSAGGLLAAGVSLRARDRRGPALAAQMLISPMLDDRNETVSSYQYDGVGTWQRASNLFAWECLLGQSAGAPDACPDIAPARATDLSGLPPAFIEAGSAEMFRDESVEYATRIWVTGGEAELLVWSGGCHGFHVFAPDSDLADIALKARYSWLRRVLRLEP